MGDRRDFRPQPMMARRNVPLYSTVRRIQIVDQLKGSIRHQWGGDLLTSGNGAAILARLWSATWQILAPDRLRREVIRPVDRARRRAWTPQNVPAGTALFLQDRARSTLLYAGEITDSRYFGSGAASMGVHYSKGWTDFEVRPALTDELWNELRFHSLFIDDRPIELAERKVIGAPELHDLLQPIRRRRTVTVTAADRVRGTLTYAKHDDGGALTHQLGGLTQRARTQHPGQGADALFIFWEYGQLSPFVQWSSRASR